MAIRGGKTLTVYLAADLKKFNRGMAQAQGGVKGLAASFRNMLAPAGIAAGVAVAGLAVKMAKDGVQAALDNEVAMSKLATTMNNLGLSHDTQKVEDYIYQLERSLGIADTDLRPAYDRLVRAIGDTDEAQQALALSLDIAAGSGKTLEQVTEALGKAYEGNIAGLSRLGAGLDAATIRSGNMDTIVATLASTFSGQATEAANTLSGRMKVLQTAVDNLGEAFGKGLLTGVDDATSGTTDMVKSMEKLEPMLEDAGETVADVAGALVDLGSAVIAVNGVIDEARNRTDVWGESLDVLLNSLNPLKPVMDWLGFGFDVVTGVLGEAKDATDAAGDAALNAVPKWNALYGATNKATAAHLAYLQAHSVKINVIKEANKDYQDLAARQQEVASWTAQEIDLGDDLTETVSGTSSAVEKLTAKEKRLAKTYEDTQLALTENRTKLALYVKELEAATAAIDDFTSGMQENLLAGVDLGKAYTSQFNDQGEKVGVGVLDGFTKMVDEAEWFGNVLNALKAQGVPDSMIQYLGEQGATVGGALGQEMLGDAGLLAGLTEKWDAVQEKTKSLAMGLVPEFITAGQESALTMIDSISEEMASQVTKLGKIGKKIAKPIGQNFKAQLLEDVAAAVAQVEATGTAARAEAVAKAEKRQVALTNAAVAQALSNIIRTADARNGAPISPVLG